MKPILVLYATHEGHTQRIAEHLAATIGARGLSATVVAAARIPTGFSLDDYSAAIVAASVHGGRHEREMIDFVKRHARELEHIPTVFLSVSLSEAGVEDATGPPERRAQAAADVERMIQIFLSETGWRPGKIKAVAGALMYTKYNFLMRWVMKHIARNAGAPTDTSRDCEFTDWAALDRLVDELVASRTVTK
jgi:menaquinone-dependent protoporphyrinogen oxidase